MFQKFYRRGCLCWPRGCPSERASDDAEASTISKLQRVCGSEYTSKRHRMFQDTGVSKDLNEQFKKRPDKLRVTGLGFQYSSTEFRIAALSGAFDVCLAVLVGRGLPAIHSLLRQPSQWQKIDMVISTVKRRISNKLLQKQIHFAGIHSPDGHPAPVQHRGCLRHQQLTGGAQIKTDFFGRSPTGFIEVKLLVL